KANHQHFSGLRPNPDPRQWQYLREQYHLRVLGSNAAYHRMNVLCLPDTAKQYEAQYADECERGMRFYEIGFHPEEQTAFFYGLMLPGGENAGRSPTQWRTFINNVIGYLGPGGDPARVLQEIRKAKLRGLNLP